MSLVVWETDPMYTKRESELNYAGQLERFVPAQAVNLELTLE